MKTYSANFDIRELMVILIVVGCVARVVWTVREHKEASEKIALAQAWREALDDPHYTERRRFEERKRVEDNEHQRAATARMSLWVISAQAVVKKLWRTKAHQAKTLLEESLAMPNSKF